MVKRSFPIKETAFLAAVVLFWFSLAVFFLRDELFPPVGIYLRYIGAQDYPVAPVIITSESLSLDKVKSRFHWDIPQMVPQFTVGRADLSGMIRQVLRWLPQKDCDPSQAQFVIVVMGGRETRTMETDPSQSRLVLNSLLELSRPKYLKLSMELLNLADYSRYDRRHPAHPPVPPASKKPKSAGSLKGLD